ncbi:hypothetical protein SLEP1_g15311 [Rubroshorea leprosula]|uniref:DUF4219 domain-containing protein n=1 Tax=Rubroshorea leprosula TaxID=152421 RepID=A0AAV5IW23_9ROSI|nr:hypothetical protein SLEP1_g15311 [Rubroshorea leprosula]
MEIDTSRTMIVPEVLKEGNYERWSILMEHYLVAQDLWDVVRSSEMLGGGNKREWMKKNALALHAIGISCGREAFDQIKNKRSAKVAWDALAAKLKPPSVVEDVTPDISEPDQERQTASLAGQQEKLQKLVCCESIPEVKRFLDRNEDMISPQMLDSALRHAITCGRKEMARYLYREIPLDFLRGDSGFFLLEHCITNGMFGKEFYNSSSP